MFAVIGLMVMMMVIMVMVVGEKKNVVMTLHTAVNSYNHTPPVYVLSAPCFFSQR